MFISSKTDLDFPSLDFTSLVQLVSTIIYFISTIYVFIREIRSCYRLRWKYFKQFWSWIEIGMISCSYSCFGVYIWRYKEWKRLRALFEQTSGYVYVNLQLAVYVNDTLTFLLGFCFFCAVIKFLRLFRSHQRLSLFTRTIHRATKELLFFSLIFAVILISFISLFHLLFAAKMSSCSTLLRTAQMLFEALLMKFVASDFIDASAILGPLSFTLFIFMGLFVGVSMLVSIISDNFRRVRHEQLNNQAMYSYMLRRFLRWTRTFLRRKGKRYTIYDLLLGLKNLTPEELHEERDARMRPTYFHPVDNFPDRIDQLLTAIDRVGHIR